MNFPALANAEHLALDEDDAFRYDPCTTLGSILSSNVKSVSDWSSDNIFSDTDDDASADFGSTTSGSDSDASWGSDTSSTDSDSSDDEPVNMEMVPIVIIIHYSSESHRVYIEGGWSGPIISVEGRQTQLIDWDKWNRIGRLVLYCLLHFVRQEWVFLSLVVVILVISNLWKIQPGNDVAPSLTRSQAVK